MPNLEEALDKEDATTVSGASEEELQKQYLAEQIFEKRYVRKKRAARWTNLAQAMVGYVALAGFFANAYQSYANKKEAAARSASDDDRWAKEFKRAQDADRYRAFFETSALVTDVSNQSKRLVGYALLKEFVDDKTYNPKATLMLEESLAQELRASGDNGLDDAHRASVEAILSALAEGSDCKLLERAARTVDKLAKHHAKTGNLDDAQEVFVYYVRKIFGRGVQVCPSIEELRRIRQPLRDTLMRVPEIGGLSGKITASQAKVKLAEILRDACQEEVLATGISDCPEIWEHYKKLCAKAEGDEVAACQIVMSTTISETAPASAPAAPPP